MLFNLTIFLSNNLYRLFRTSQNRMDTVKDTEFTILKLLDELIFMSDIKKK